MISLKYLGEKKAQMETDKLTIVTDKGKADVNILEGKSFHVLEDHSRDIFSTNNIPALEKYINVALPQPEKKRFIILPME